MAVGASLACACSGGRTADLMTTSPPGRLPAGPASGALGEADWGEDRAAGTARGDAAYPWTIVLWTFTSPGHASSAHTMISEVRQIDPRLGAARVRTTEKGSMVVYGRFLGPDSREAQANLKWIKEITLGGRQVFTRAMLSRIKSRASRPRHPHELMSVRARHPNVDPLYTLEVAVWGDFESGELTLEEIHRHAERYARELRGQGFKAYFHHDDGQRLSIVTVGVFNHTAIDHRSGLYSAEVEALRRRFPAHLVNGEPLNELVNPRFPKLGTRIQQSRLVVVPKR